MKSLDAAQRARVMVVSRIYHPEPAAASFRLRALQNALVAAGAQVRVLTTKDPRASAMGEQPLATQQSAPSGSDVVVSRWPVLRDNQGYVRGYAQYLSFDIPVFFRILFSRRADVAVVEPPPTTGVVARLALALRRTPYVWYAPDVWSDATQAMDVPRAVQGAVRWMEGFAMRGAHLVVAVSEEIAQRAKALGAKDVVVVPNGIDTEVFTADGPRLSASELEAVGLGSQYLIYAGTASEWQGAHVFIEALRQARRHYAEAQILFLGQGSAIEALKEQAAQIEAAPSGRTAVVFLRTVPPIQAAAWQRCAAAALVSIQPSTGYDYAYPTKVLSALACGTPVIYAGAGPAATEVADNALGWAVAHDAAEVAPAIVAALDAARDEGARGQARRQRLATWVSQHRSSRASGRKVADIVMKLARSA